MITTAKRQFALFLLLALIVPLLAACGGAGSTGSATSAPAPATSAPAATTTAPAATAAPEPTAMAEPTAAGGAATGEFKPRAVTAKLTGSGASFPDPIYQAWIKNYKTVAPTVEINYQSVGSGQGRKDFFGGVTDFGGSDKYASDSELKAATDPNTGTLKVEVLHIPTVLGSVVATYNLPGVEKLQFSGEALAGIFLGTITNWNDPMIAADNPGVTLPDMEITVAHRSDGSGTTSIFTNYLSSVSPDWKSKVGAGDTVQWPTGQGGEKNPGVAAIVQQTEGAIGYVELIYALSNKLPVPAVKNAAGKYVVPSLESTSAAAQGFLAKTPDDLRVNIVNPPEGETAYPIAGYTWVLVPKEWKDEAKAQALTDFLYWAITNGSETAKSLNYAPLPDEIRTKAIAKLGEITVNGAPAFTAP
ncbi:MAG: phosphate ABC transporter substrate-binding protein PstS [Roseiflexaceae bacterium]